MSEASAHKRRWARIWAARLRQLARDMNVPPPSDMPDTEWKQLQDAALKLADQIDTALPPQGDD